MGSDGSADYNRVLLTDAGEEIMGAKKQQQFNYHYFERPNAATDALNLARTLFDLREYRKCANILKPYANEKYQQALFLHNYALFIVAEHSREEESLQAGEKIESSTSPSTYKELG